VPHRSLTAVACRSRKIPRATPSRTAIATRAIVSFALNPARSYLMTGALVGKDGGNYGQVYISMLCTVLIFRRPYGRW
jgi:hypothetical protein